MKKEGNGFKGTINIPWKSKITYKFIVDGEWLVNSQEPTETDDRGNVNNVYTAPEKPSVTSQSNGTSDEPNSVAHGKPSTTTNGIYLPQLVSDLATSIAAREGTTSAFGYVASGVGAAMKGVIGVDPINPDPVHKLAHQFSLSTNYYVVFVSCPLPPPPR